MIPMLASEAAWWARKNNVEAAWCWMPNAQTVIDGVVAVGAYGNDGTGVRILLDSDECHRADPDTLAQIGMLFLGKALAAVRREEAAGYR